MSRNATLEKEATKIHAVRSRIAEERQKRYERSKEKLVPWKITEANKAMAATLSNFGITENEKVREIKEHLSHELEEALHESSSIEEFNALAKKVVDKAVYETFDYAHEQAEEKEAEEKAHEQDHDKEHKPHAHKKHQEDHEEQDEQSERDKKVAEEVAKTGATGTTAKTMEAIKKGVQTPKASTEAETSAKGETSTEKNNPWVAYKQKHDKVIADAKKVPASTKHIIGKKPETHPHGGAAPTRTTTNTTSQAVKTFQQAMAKNNAANQRQGQTPTKASQTNNPWAAFAQSRQTTQSVKVSESKPPEQPRETGGEIVPHSNNAQARPLSRVERAFNEAPILVLPSFRKFIPFRSQPEESFGDDSDDIDDTPSVRGNPRSDNPGSQSRNETPRGRDDQQNGNQDDNNDNNNSRGRRRLPRRGGPRRIPRIGNAGRALGNLGKAAGRAATQLAVRGAVFAGGFLVSNPVGWAILALLLIVLLLMFYEPPVQNDLAEEQISATTTCEPAKVTVGQVSECTLRVSYNGSAEDAIVKAQILPGAEFVSAIPEALYNDANKDYTWSARETGLQVAPVNFELKISIRAIEDNKTVPIVFNVNLLGGRQGGISGGGDFPASQDNCGGKYRLGTQFNNFGDPNCDFDKQKLGLAIQNADPANAYKWDTLAECESSYNPNAFNGNSTSGKGAYGLFQMNPAGQGNGEFDAGNVYWEKQLTNAVAYNNKLNGSFRYWECRHRF